ncbi:UNVERIFIED_CONTAM: hypothetical protein FKN15_035677 [Acipenser sinensis]
MKALLTEEPQQNSRESSCGSLQVTSVCGKIGVTFNQAASLGASKKRQQTKEPQQKSQESSCGSPARGGLH